MSIDVAARVRQQAQAAHGSGSLGPLHAPFAEVVAVAQRSSPSLDLTRDQLEEERRQLGNRIQEIASNLDSSLKMLNGLQEKRTATASRLRDIEAKPGQFSRHEIIKAYQEYSKADTDHAQLRELCDHLRTQADFAKKMHDSLDKALRVTADAVFLRENDDLDRAAQSLAADISQVRRIPTKSLIDHDTMLAAREYERHALARSVEERIRTALADVVLQTETYEALIRADPQHAANVARDLKSRLAEVLRGAEALIFELEPATLNDLGLAATLQRYAQDVTTTYGVPISVRVSGVARRCPSALERLAFRAAREGITNALRHGHPRHIQVALHVTSKGLFLTVMDDGVGFDVDTVMAQVQRGYHSGLGQLCIEADLFGAELGLESSAGHGAWFHFIVEEARDR